MPGSPQELFRAGSAKSEFRGTKADKDGSSVKAERRSFLKSELGSRFVKSELGSRLQVEKPASIKAELGGSSIIGQRVGVKAEQRVGVKAEQRASVETQQPARVKAEGGTSASSSGSVLPLPPLSAKIEQLRQIGVSRIKKELLGTSGIENLVARGLQMREKQTVKREKGTRGKINKTLVKVKKERARNKDGSLRKKPRTTAKKRRASREVMAREVALSSELSDLLGAEACSRPDAVRRLWAYCRDHNMLNPNNKREIHFDEKLQQMMGQPTATMPQLISLMMPHFDYTKPVVKQETKQERTKKEAKAEQSKAAKRELKAESKKEEDKVEAKKEPNKIQAKKELNLARSGTSTKRELHADPAVGSKRMKHEQACVNLNETASPIVVDPLGSVVPHICSFDRTSAVIECVVPPGVLQVEAIATPINNNAANSRELRVPCKVDFREDAHGSVKPHAEARLDGLDSKLSYHITVQASSGDGGCSLEVLLPQRAHPAQWSSRDVMAWCHAQHVPELVRMTQDYGIDGSTLLSLSEEDLKASGVVAPFLLRRTLNNLAALRAAGT